MRAAPRTQRATMLALLGLSTSVAAAAQTTAPQTGAAPAAPAAEGQLSTSQPVTFTADQVQYDKVNGIVTATGHVEAWQGGQMLRADKVSFDRNTNVMAASGHVQIIEPDGQIVFSNYAELSSDMKQGVLRDMRGIMAANGKLAANGARRTPGPINTLSRGIYSTCNICVKHPKRPPLWDLRARTLVQDVPNKRIEYYNSWLDVMGVPVLYMPYFSSADPSVKRQSGFLVPAIGNSTYLGAFASVPYYWVIDKSSDATIIPLLGSDNAGQLETIYRRSFNNGTLNADVAGAYVQGQAQGALFTSGRFNFNDTWRYGFDINQTSSLNYLRDFNTNGLLGNVLNTDFYVEGFGEGAYAKVSALSYQGLNSTVTDSLLPYVLPRYQYDYVSQPNVWGGQISVDTNDFNVVRQIGTNDQRANLNLQWERTGIGALGDVWTLTGRVESETYNAFDLNQQPNYGHVGQSTTVRVQPTLAFKVNWPFVRAGAKGSSLLVEPIVQFVAAPNTSAGMYAAVPNEDSLAPEFSDMTLFSLNRFQGIDRQEGGLRTNLGLHANWTTKIGMFDGLIGQSYRVHADNTMPAYVGLNRHISDVVARITYTPDKYIDLTVRTRLDNQNYNVHFAEGIASVGPQWLRVSAGYYYSPNTPYFLDFQPAQGNPLMPRNEASLAVSTKHGRWRFSGFAQRDLQNSLMVDAGLDGAYEDECSVVELKVFRRYTSINGDHGETTALIQITLKTVGTFGFNAL